MIIQSIPQLVPNAKAEAFRNLASAFAFDDEKESFMTFDDWDRGPPCVRAGDPGELMLFPESLDSEGLKHSRGDNRESERVRFADPAASKKVTKNGY
ncbi:hypothetical protein [Bradyrhizobium sp. 151]|uniref:hypothetical protein n=1 Tax=Bradyrhizobium sp. 151 TaxID=2782626 RepID=UPI001FFA1D0E|nr:hypothetical protein [Bradyrhizobium sp. 151]MCK1656594.1 hypothetical protein [Bradyrhizobium sp. 151]